MYVYVYFSRRFVEYQLEVGTTHTFGLLFLLVGIMNIAYIECCKRQEIKNGDTYTIVKNHVTNKVSM